MKVDTVAKAYIKDVNIFADIFNYYIYNGEQVIKTDRLRECDTNKAMVIPTSNGKSINTQKNRDVQKIYTKMTDGDMEYILLSIEEQTKVHNAMPVRNYLYDALDYTIQIEEIAKQHRKEYGENESAEHNITQEEFLSGFHKSDRIIPSITVTILFEPDKWNGPRSLYDMMNIKDKNMLKYINNYHINLIEPAQMTDEEINKFKSTMREVLLTIKYSKDKEKLKNIINTDERFKRIERRAVDLIKAVTNMSIKYDEKEEAVDMCQAIKEMMEDERAEGRNEGIEIGKELGLEQKAKEMVINLYKIGISVDKIAQAANYDISTIKSWIENFGIEREDE